MARPWAEVQQSPQFQQLPPEKQQQAQRQYFDTVVAPKLTDPAKKEAAWGQFQAWKPTVEPEAEKPGLSLLDRTVEAGKRIFGAMDDPFGRGQPSESVMTDAPVKPRQGTAPVTQQAREQVQAAYDRDPGGRATLLARDDWRGQVAREIDGGRTAVEDLPAAAALDTRHEAVARRARGAGADWETAQSIATGGDTRPVATASESPESLVDRLGRMAAEQTGDEQARTLVKGAVDLAGSVAKVAPTTGKMALDTYQLIPLFGRAAEAGSDALADVIEDLGKIQSGEMQGKAVRLSETVRNGTPDQVMQLLLQNPDLLADVAIPSAGSMFLIGGAGSATGSVQAARLAGRLSPRALARVRQRAATDGAVWANAAVNAGAAYDETEGGALAKYTAALIAGAGTRAVGVMTKGGAEGVLARGASSSSAHPVVAAGRVAGREMAQEFGEGGSEALGVQTGDIIEGRRDGYDLRQIANQATLEAAAGGPMGAAVGAMHYRNPEDAQAQREAYQNAARTYREAYRQDVNAAAVRALSPGNAQFVEAPNTQPEPEIDNARVDATSSVAGRDIPAGSAGDTQPDDGLGAGGSAAAGAPPHGGGTDMAVGDGAGQPADSLAALIAEAPAGQPVGDGGLDLSQRQEVLLREREAAAVERGDPLEVAVVRRENEIARQSSGQADPVGQEAAAIDQDRLLEDVMLMASGKPFPSETAAASSARQRKLDRVPVQVGEGWGLAPRQATPREQTAVDVPVRGQGVERRAGREHVPDHAAPMLMASGRPFPSERAASSSAKQRRLDLTPVEVEGGWGLVPQTAPGADISADTNQAQAQQEQGLQPDIRRAAVADAPARQVMPFSRIEANRLAVRWRSEGRGDFAVVAHPHNAGMFAVVPAQEADRYQPAPPQKRRPAQPLSIGTAPGSAEPITVRDGVVFIGDYPAQDYDTAEDITVPEGADNATIAQALRDAGAVGRRQKIFGVRQREDDGEDRGPRFSRSDTAGELLMPASEAKAYYDAYVSGVGPGVTVPPVSFVIGEMSATHAGEIAKYADIEQAPTQLRITGRTIKHADERRQDVAAAVVPNLKSFFLDFVEVLPNHQNKGRVMLASTHKRTESNKSYVAAVEVEIRKDALYIVSFMSMPDRTLRKARELKANWSEGQQPPRGDSPHPVAAKAAHAEADSSDVRPVDPSISPTPAPIKSDKPANRAGQNADEFVQAPDGSIDFGEITAEMASTMRRQAGKIRLQQGEQNADGAGWGLAHIEANHGNQIRNAGFQSVQHFVAHVAGNFNEVLQAQNRQLLVAVDGGRQDVMFVQLEPTDGGDFYRINTAFQASRNYLEKQQKKGMKLLWGGSEPAPAATGQQPPYAGAPAEQSGQGAPIARGQSSDGTVAQEQPRGRMALQPSAPAAQSPSAEQLSGDAGESAAPPSGQSSDIVAQPASAPIKSDKPANSLAARVDDDTGFTEPFSEEGDQEPQFSRGSAFTPDAYDAKQYAAAVDRIAAMPAAPRTDLTIGDTPAVLRAIGAKPLPMQMPSSVVQKASRPEVRNHDVPVDVIKNIPFLIADPVLVYESPTERGALVAVVDAKDKSGRAVIVAVHLGVRGSGFHNINKIASIYGKDDVAGIEKAMQGSLRYYNNEKAAQWLRAVGLQLPEANTIKRLNPDVTTQLDVVKLSRSLAGYPLAPAAIDDTGFTELARSYRARGITPDTLREAVAQQFPSLSRAVERMIERGQGGQKGGLVVIDSAHEQDIAEAFAEKTGRSLDEVVQYFSDAEGINGFFDPRSGITFMVGPNLTAQSAPAVLMHEMIHGQQRADIDADAVRLLSESDHPLHTRKTRDFLKRVQERIEYAGETGNPKEAAAYIVEQAVIEGRQAGFSAVDGRILDWIDSTLGKRIGNFIRNFAAMVRTWAVRHGAEARNLTVDDLVAIARAGVKRAGRGDVQTTEDGAARSMVGDALAKALRGLATMARASGNENKTVTLGAVTEQQASLLQREKIAVDGSFSHTADMFAVRHAINRHGDAKVEKNRGQIAITDSDVEQIARAVASPTAYVLGGKTPRGQDLVGYIKRLDDGTLLYLEEVRSGRKTLAMTSMRKYPGTTDFDAIASSLLPSNARSDAGDVHIVYPDGREGQGDDAPQFSRAGPPPANPPAPPNAGPLFSAPAFPEGPVKRKLENVRYQIQDRFIDLKRVQEAIRDAGRTIRDEFDPHMLETLMHGKAAYRVQRFTETEVDPILTELRMTRISMDRFQKYLHARHAVERNAEMARRNPNQAELDAKIAEAARALDQAQSDLLAAEMANVGTGVARQNVIRAQAELQAFKNIKPWSGMEADRKRLSGMSNDEALSILSTEHAGPQGNIMKRLAQKVDDITARTRQEMAGYGLETVGAVATWDKLYKHYVPLKRDMDESDLLGSTTGTGAGISIRGSMVKEATGSLREVEHIFANIVAQREAAIVRGEKNVVAKALYGLVLENPNSDMWTVIRPGMNEAALRAELQRMGLNGNEVGSFTQAPTTATIDERTGMVVQRINPNYAGMDNAVVLRVGGEDRVILLSRNNDRAVRLAGALRNADTDHAGVMKFVMERIGPATRYLAAINTQYNPIFGITNLTRDVQEALLNLESTAIAGKQREVFWNIKKAIAGARNYERGDKRHAWASIYEEFLQDGGATGFRDQFADMTDRASAIALEVNGFRFKDAKGVRQNLSVLRNTVIFKQFADLLSDYNTVLENGVRLAVYKTARDAGISRAQAANIAKDITVNFNRKGARSSALASLFAFFNSAAQGIERQLRTVTHPVVGKKIVSGLLMFGVIEAVMGIMAFGDDWDEIPVFERERNFIIPVWPSGKSVVGEFLGVTESGGHYLKIPKPLGFYYIPNVSRTLTEMAWFQDRIGERTTDMLLGVFESHNPLGSSGDPMLAVTPTVLDPAIEIGRNRTGLGREIFREDFDSQRPTPGFDRAKQGTNFLWVALAEAANTLTRGDEEKPGLWSPEPEKFAHLFGVISGGPGREIDKAISTVEGWIAGTDVPPHRIPLAGRFYGEVGGNAMIRQKFFDAVKEVNIADGSVTGKIKRGVDYSDRDDALASLVKFARQDRQTISDLRKEMDQTKDRNQRKEIENEIVEIQRQFVEMYEEEIGLLMQE